MMSPVDLACNEIIPQDGANYWQFLESCGKGSTYVPFRKSTGCSKMKTLIAGCCVGINRGDVTFSDNVHLVSHCGLEQCYETLAPLLCLRNVSGLMIKDFVHINPLALEMGI